MARVDKDQIVEAHEPHGTTFWVWWGFVIGFFSMLGLTGWALATGPIWLVVLLVLATAHLMHTHILAFHEAAHRTLSASPFWNEFAGLLIGTLSFQGLTAFRAVHHSHHAYLGTERDEELWPFVVPTIPRWGRCFAAFFELTFGILYTPLLCLRTFLRSDSPMRNPAERRRVWLEFVLMAAVWGAILSTVAWFHAWKYLLVAYVIPGVLAGNMHTLRKYIEHMGMTGPTVLGMTRSILTPGPIGRFLSFTLFNINYHGIHHRYAKIPQARLPRFTPLLEPENEGEHAPYPSYRAALADMLRSLADPRVGSQWERVRYEEVEPEGVLAESVASS